MKIIILFSLAILIGSCQSKNSKTDGKNKPNVHQVTIREVLQTNSYSYLKVKENDKENWLAVVRIDAKVGDTYYYEEGMVMDKFKSKELKKEFEKIIFVDKISKEPFTEEKKKELVSPGAEKVKPGKQQVIVEKAKDGISIAELYAKKDSYANKVVRIKGQVMKFNEDIMDKNWIHLQDGTESDGNFDLTITSKSVVKVGEVITFEGTIALNKDFGYGYKYSLLMENAIKKE